jgi:alpha-L-fucosidase 2
MKTPPCTRRQFLQTTCLAALFCLLPHDTRGGPTPIPQNQELTLWYRQPAPDWNSALPIGNGRLGAMIFGGVSREQLQLNEDTLWAGGPYDPVNPAAAAALPEARKLVFDGKYADAAKLISSSIMAKPLRQMPYETVGDLLLDFPETAPVQNYRRDLDLDTAVASVSYTANGVQFTREIFSSPVDQVIVVRLTASQRRKINFTAGMKTPQKATIETEMTGGVRSIGKPEAGAEVPVMLVLRGTNGAAEGVRGALRFEARASISAQGGTMRTASNTVSVTDADSAILLIAVATSFKNFHDVSGDPGPIVARQIAAAGKKSFDKLLKAHIAEHQRLFRRVSLDLGASQAMQLPTDERIRNFNQGNDPGLAALYFQFGRYLLISSSRPGCQPAGLQGIWNNSMSPPWGGKYTININTEMNYWPAETCNLAECVEPLIAMVQDLTQTGAHTAQAMYGARGWVVHHNTDLWRAAAPIDGPNSGMWPTGGAWLSTHLWEHYQFSGDKKFLAKAWPAMKGATLFFLDTLVEEPKHHWLVTNPSLSPEHSHPFGTAVCVGPAMDMQILRDLFAQTIQAAEILGLDADFRRQLAAARARLAPNQIGAAGQLQEWLEDWDMQAPDIHHRHVSHLYGLFPGHDISLRGAPEFAAAAKKSLEIRGDQATGWATAWRINLWDHLADGDHAFEILKFLLSPQRTYPNMFDAHPPFQIDGNFGGASGIAEMLLQSGEGEIELLPALPKAWPDGRVQGLRARGGFEVDMAWKDGRLAEAVIHSLAGNPARLRYGTATRDLRLSKGKTLRWDGR